MQKVICVDHPLVKHKLSLLRDRNTVHWEFAQVLTELTVLLAVEATRTLRLRRDRVETPLEAAQVEKLDEGVVLVPILRAGLGMVEGFKRIFPLARVGFVGLFRDEETLQPQHYYTSLPERLDGDAVFVLDPMLATGGSVVYALNLLRKSGVDPVTVVSVISAPEGISFVHGKYPEVTIVTAAVDRCLNDRGYILPGLGDAGDRIFGTLAEEA